MCHEGLVRNMLGTRQELSGEMESCNNPDSMSILIAASLLLFFFLFCYNVGKEPLS